MSVRLGWPREPRWLDLPEGVRVKVRPYNPVIERSATRRSVELARKLVEDAQRVEAFGVDIGQLSSIDIDDLAWLLYVVQVATAAITEWHGPIPVDGKEGDAPPAITEDTVVDLMFRPGMAEAFIAAYRAPIAAVSAEGNGSAPAPAGTAATGATTAEPAVALAPDVPADGAGSTGADAPTMSTPQ